MMFMAGRDSTQCVIGGDESLGCCDRSALEDGNNIGENLVHAAHRFGGLIGCLFIGNERGFVALGSSILPL
jgi:hypothetical protein